MFLCLCVLGEVHQDISDIYQPEVTHFLGWYSNSYGHLRENCPTLIPSCIIFVSFINCILGVKAVSAYGFDV